jgi:excisionase family DNA binding protein
MRTIAMEQAISKLLTAKQSAILLGLSEETIRRWIQTRRIRYVKVGAKAIRIPEDEIQRIIAEGTVRPRRELTQTRWLVATAQEVQA